MKDLIEALTILLKYDNPRYPTNCDHDELYVCVNPTKVSRGDIKRLDELGFFPNDDNDGFISFRFGSC